MCPCESRLSQTASMRQRRRISFKVFITAEGTKSTITNYDRAPAGLIIVISELSNIGQTPSCIPDYLDRTIVESETFPSSRGSNFSLCNNRGYRREYMNTSTFLALVFVFLSLISLLWADPTWDTPELPLGDNPSRISELGLRSRMKR